jgi:uridine phosphorylase
LAEELAVAGIRQIVAVDIAGSLDPALKSGSLVLASTAVCSDGTSQHYASPGASVQADAALTKSLAETKLGTGVLELRSRGLFRRRKFTEIVVPNGIESTSATVWSTDAPYRETRSLIEEARRYGAALIDMETAALYASCAALGIATASLLVVADEIFDEWRPPGDMPLIQAQLRRAASIAVSLLRDDSRSLR